MGRGHVAEHTYAASFVLVIGAHLQGKVLSLGLNLQSAPESTLLENNEKYLLACRQKTRVLPRFDTREGLSTDDYIPRR